MCLIASYKSNLLGHVVQIQHNSHITSLVYKIKDKALVSIVTITLCTLPLPSSKNKLEYRVFPTLHKRGLGNLATNAPRVQPPEMPADKSHDDSWLVWTAAQDRTLIAYSMKKQKPPRVYNTCGGFVYKIVPCPYDAKK